MRYPTLNASGVCNSKGITPKFTELCLMLQMIIYKTNPSGLNRATNLHASQREKGLQPCHSDLPDITAEIVFLIHHFSHSFAFFKPCLLFYFIKYKVFIFTFNLFNCLFLSYHICFLACSGTFHLSIPDSLIPRFKEDPLWSFPLSEHQASFVFHMIGT